MDYRKFLIQLSQTYSGSLKRSVASSLTTLSSFIEFSFQYIIIHTGKWLDMSVVKIAVLT